MCVCVYIYIYIYIYTFLVYIHTYIHTHTRTQHTHRYIKCSIIPNFLYLLTIKIMYSVIYMRILKHSKITRVCIIVKSISSKCHVMTLHVAIKSVILLSAVMLNVMAPYYTFSTHYLQLLSLEICHWSDHFS